MLKRRVNLFFFFCDEEKIRNEFRENETSFLILHLHQNSISFASLFLIILLIFYSKVSYFLLLERILKTKFKVSLITFASFLFFIFLVFRAFFFTSFPCLLFWSACLESCKFFEKKGGFFFKQWIKWAVLLSGRFKFIECKNQTSGNVME